ncbi:MAG TPA: hypothetical protein VME70_03360 [Mycobacteriales bacterium]|nr:hypothetical protein [Mycobacteriales bacterium]
MSSRSSGEPPTVPDYLFLAFLRDGRFRCVAAALAVLHASGHLDAGGQGTVRRPEDAATAPPDGLERVIWQAVHGHVAPGALAARGPVDTALTTVRHQLVHDGALRRLVPTRSWLPARTHRGRKRITLAMQACPWPLVPPEQGTRVEDRIGLPVALYGNYALRELLPAFARESGLLDRSSSDTGPGETYSAPDRSSGYSGGA